MTQASVVSSLTASRLEKFVKEKMIEDSVEFGYRHQVIPLAGSRVNEVKSEFIKVLKQRGISYHEYTFSDSGYNYIVLKRIFKPGEETAVAIRIEAFGNDLIVETRDYEWSQSAYINSRLFGIFGLIIGLPFFWTGVAWLLILPAIAALRVHPTLSGQIGEEASNFRRAVHTSIKLALDNLGI